MPRKYYPREDGTLGKFGVNTSDDDYSSSRAGGSSDDLDGLVSKVEEAYEMRLMRASEGPSGDPYIDYLPQYEGGNEVDYW